LNDQLNDRACFFRIVPVGPLARQRTTACKRRPRQRLPHAPGNVQGSSEGQPGTRGSVTTRSNSFCSPGLAPVRGGGGHVRHAHNGYAVGSELRLVSGAHVSAFPRSSVNDARRSLQSSLERSLARAAAPTPAAAVTVVKIRAWRGS
jgi:hypothetical protein